MKTYYKIKKRRLQQITERRRERQIRPARIAAPTENGGTDTTLWAILFSATSIIYVQIVLPEARQKPKLLAKQATDEKEGETIADILQRSLSKKHELQEHFRSFVTKKFLRSRTTSLYPDDKFHTLMGISYLHYKRLRSS